MWQNFTEKGLYKQVEILQMKEIQELRAQIDKADEKINQYLDKRYELVKEIKKIKKTSSLPVQDKGREDQILTKCSNEHSKEVFKEILKQSRIMQKKGL